MSDVWWHFVVVLLLGLVPIGWLGVRYAQLAAVWRGERPRFMAGSNRLFSVYPRSYLTYLATATCYLGGPGILLLSAAGRVVAMGIIGVALAVATVPVLCLHAVVNMFNRPAFLVPPRYRSLRGTVAESAGRRARVRAGRPPTDHQVTIHEVRPFDAADYAPYLVAICDEDHCGWTQFADAPDGIETPAGLAAADAALRVTAAGHTTNVATERFRPLS
jgi:hypothetical protein